MNKNSDHQLFVRLFSIVGLFCFSCSLAAETPQGNFKTVTCAGEYPGHLQGVCVDDESIYWSFTTELVKTDQAGKILKKIPVLSHHGDLCYHTGKVYVAVNLGKFNDPQGNADSWVYVYDAKDLSFLSKHETQEVFHGAGGMAFQAGHFFVVGGLPADIEVNYVYEYDDQFKFIRRHEIASGQTHLGIQSAAFSQGRWWFGCYGKPNILLVTDENFKMLGRYKFSCSLGIVGIPGKQFLSATGGYTREKGHTGTVHVSIQDEDQGLRYLKEK